MVFTIPVLVEEEARRIEYQLLAVLKPEIKLLWLWSCRKFKAQIKRSKRTEVVNKEWTGKMIHFNFSSIFGDFFFEIFSHITG